MSAGAMSLTGGVTRTALSCLSWVGARRSHPSGRPRRMRKIQHLMFGVGRFVLRLLGLSSGGGAASQEGRSDLGGAPHTINTSPIQPSTAACHSAHAAVFMTVATGGRCGDGRKGFNRRAPAGATGKKCPHIGDFSRRHAVSRPAMRG